jgi:pimeloyl-ACP methyl ester carboxylesterase
MRPLSFTTGMALAALWTLSLAGCAKYSKVLKMSPSAIIATEEQRSMQAASSRLFGQPLAKIGLYLDAANTARLKLASNPSDSQALSDYNFAVSRIMEILGDNELAPWNEALVCPSEGGENWSLGFDPRGPHEKFNLSDFKFLPTDRYKFKGTLVGERKFKNGIGAPLMVSSNTQDYTKIDEFAQGKSIYYGLTAAIEFDGTNGRIFLKDPLAEESIQFDGHAYPMAADFQAPLAFALAELNPRKTELRALFKPDQYGESAQLSRLQPYDPQKIPVLFIHGFSNSKATWAPMVESLRHDPMFRQHYQVWTFNYPTGVPYPMAARELRRDLDGIRKRYPDHKDIVVVGHSMGGMISSTLITDSGMTLWNAVFEKPPGEMGFDESTRKLLSEWLIYKARPDVARVIYASTTHRGTEIATSRLGRFGAKLVGAPLPSGVISGDVVAASRTGGKKGRIPNSVDVLDPDSPFLVAIDTLSPKRGVPYHSLIGDRGLGGNLDKTEPASSDGVVPYWSSHLDGAESELVIPSGHWTILHPQGMAEVKRILHRHLEEKN